jgi:large subunit ribosomal protein L21
MEAVIRDGGHQYKVMEGQTLDVEYRDLEAGSTVEFPEVLLVHGGDVDVQIGTPLVDGAKVVAKVVGPVRGEKLVVAKFRRRKGLRKRTGHRQSYLRVQVESIQA